MKFVPPVDTLKGVLMERRQAYGYTFRDLAVLTGYSASHLRHLFGDVRTEDWEPGPRHKVCEVLGVK